MHMHVCLSVCVCACGTCVVENTLGQLWEQIEMCSSSAKTSVCILDDLEHVWRDSEEQRVTVRV